MKSHHEELSDIMGKFANLSFENHKYELAENTYTDSIKQSPENYKSYFSRATLYRLQGNLTAAYNDVEQAAKLCPPNLQSFFNNTLKQIKQEQEDSQPQIMYCTFFAQPLHKLPAHLPRGKSKEESLLKYVLCNNQNQANWENQIVAQAKTNHSHSLGY